MFLDARCPEQYTTPEHGHDKYTRSGEMFKTGMSEAGLLQTLQLMDLIWSEVNGDSNDELVPEPVADVHRQGEDDNLDAEGRPRLTCAAKVYEKLLTTTEENASLKDMADCKYHHVSGKYPGKSDFQKGMTIQVFGGKGPLPRWEYVYQFREIARFIEKQAGATAIETGKLLVTLLERLSLKAMPDELRAAMKQIKKGVFPDLLVKRFNLIRRHWDMKTQDFFPTIDFVDAMEFHRDGDAVKAVSRQRDIINQRVRFKPCLSFMARASAEVIERCMKDRSTDVKSLKPQYMQIRDGSRGEWDWNEEDPNPPGTPVDRRQPGVRHLVEPRPE